MFEKQFPILILILLLVSCGSFDTSKIAPGYKDTYTALRNSIIGFPESEISPDVIKRIPYASMLLNVGKGPKGLVILETILQDQYTWISADQIFLVLRNGKIIETRGFPNNLINLVDRKLDFKDIILGGATQSKAFYSYDKPELKNLKIELSYEVVGKEEINILDKRMNLTKIEERGKSEIIGWYFINEYWVDQGFTVWKSNQYISPKLPQISYLVTKKPSE